MNKTIAIVILSTLFTLSASAQRRKPKAKPKPVVVEKTAEEKLYEELLPSTAKIMFIDSVQVAKKDILNNLAWPSDMGKLTEANGDVAFTNEFGTTMIYAYGDSIKGRNLYMTHRNGKTWEEARKLDELEAKMADFPFLMSDGVTLYFSAEGDETVGGRDIFRTTFNSDESKFYEPTNMGLPINSPANEYLLAISDIDNLGWLVSDRNQPQDTVCIYIFEPTKERKTFSDETSEDVLNSYAKINSIKDTWKFGNRQEAMKRLFGILNKMTNSNGKSGVFFVVNDKKVYTSLNDFKTDASRAKYKEILTTKSKLSQLTMLLNSSRQEYSRSSKAQKRELGRKIVELERDIEEIEVKLHNAEKDLRNKENNK